MISCRFENGAPAALRHVVVHAVINSRPDRPREDRQNVAFDFVICISSRVAVRVGQRSSGDNGAW